MKTRKPLSPATGSCRWEGRDPVSGNRLLRITCGEVSRVYEIEEVQTGRVWNLHTLDEKDFSLLTYRVTTGEKLNKWTCDCPDAKWRPERKHDCKHSRALRAALSAEPF